MLKKNSSSVVRLAGTPSTSLSNFTPLTIPPLSVFQFHPSLSYQQSAAIPHTTHHIRFSNPQLSLSAVSQLNPPATPLVFPRRNENLTQNMSKVIRPAMDLKQFMLRQEVLKLYRDIFRCIRQIPDKSTQQELRDWARYDFRSNMQQTEELAIKMLIQHGRRSLTELQNSLHLSGNTSKTT